MPSSAPGAAQVSAPPGAPVAPGHAGATTSRRSLTALLSRPSAATWIVAGLTVLAFALRCGLINQSLNGDELFLYVIVHDHSLGDVLSAVHHTEKTPPLGFVLSWLFAQAGDDTLTVRFPSFLASVATVPLVYLLGRRTVGRGAGIVAAAWFAISPFELFYGVETRSYAQVTAFAVLSTLALLVAVEDRRKRWWALYALATAAALYSHYIVVLTLVPQAAWALWRHRESAREQLLAYAGVALAFLPWVPSFLVQAGHSDTEASFLATVAPLTLERVGTFSTKPLVGHPFFSLAEFPGRIPGAVIVAALVAGLVSVVYPWVTKGVKPTPPRAWLLLVLLVLVPLAGLVLYSARPHHSFLVPRNLSVAVPYALLLIGWLITRPPPRIAVPLALAALAALAVGTVKSFDPDNQRPDAEDVARYVDAHAPPNAAYVDSEIIPWDQGPAHAIRVYLRRPHRVYPGDRLAGLWDVEARARAPIFVSFYLPKFAESLVHRCGPPPPPHDKQFRLIAEHSARGFVPIVVCGYAPR